MKGEVHLIIMTFDIKEGSIKVLVDKDRLPFKRISSDSPSEAIETVSQKYIGIDPKFIQYELCGETYDKPNKTLALYYYAFLPSPVNNKKGIWGKAWEVYRNPEDELVFEIIQQAATKAFRRTQAGHGDF